MTAAEIKKALRREIITAERELSIEEKAAADAAIREKLLSTEEYKSAETVFCFVGIEREIDTRGILADILAAGKRLCVPRCIGAGCMEAKEILSLADLSPGSFGIPEPPETAPTVRPDEIDLAVVPCLSCSHTGSRLGRGGGFYDRFLQSFHGNALTLCREALIRENIPMEEHDVAIPIVITDKGIYRNG